MDSELLWFVLLLMLKPRSVWFAVHLMHTHLLKIGPVNLSAAPIDSNKKSQLASSIRPGGRLVFNEMNLRKVTWSFIKSSFSFFVCGTTIMSSHLLYRVIKSLITFCL